MKNTALLFAPYVVMLTACGGAEPSETDMFNALHDSLLRGVTEGGRDDFKKGECQKVGDKTYKCTFGGKDGKGIAASLGFTKIDGKWQVIGNP